MIPVGIISGDKKEKEGKARPLSLIVMYDTNTVWFWDWLTNRWIETLQTDGEILAVEIIGGLLITRDKNTVWAFVPLAKRWVRQDAGANEEIRAVKAF